MLAVHVLSACRPIYMWGKAPAVHFVLQDVEGLPTGAGGSSASIREVKRATKGVVSWLMNTTYLTRCAGCVTVPLTRLLVYVCECVEVCCTEVCIHPMPCVCSVTNVSTTIQQGTRCLVTRGDSVSGMVLRSKRHVLCCRASRPQSDKCVQHSEAT